MKPTWSLLLLWLALLGSADAQNLEPFQEESPDGKFEVVCDLHAQPPFKIIRQASVETLATMGAEGVSNRCMKSSWSPDSQLLVVLATWKWWTEIDIFRLVGGRFERVKAPVANVEDLSFDRWIAPNKLRLGGDDHPRTLVITNHAAKFAR